MRDKKEKEPTTKDECVGCQEGINKEKKKTWELRDDGQWADK